MKNYEYLLNRENLKAFILGLVEKEQFDIPAKGYCTCEVCPHCEGEFCPVDYGKECPATDEELVDWWLEQEV